MARERSMGVEVGGEGLERILALAVAELGSTVTLVLHPRGQRPAGDESASRHRVPILSSSGRLDGFLDFATEHGDLSDGERTLAEQLARLVARRLEADERANAVSTERLERIRDVLDRRSFQVLHQPIVDLHTGATVGCEALLRFRTPPIAPPDRWFAEAASVGLGVELELAAVAAVLAGFDAVPGGAYLSVNVSPAAVVATAFGRLMDDVDLTRVVVEITEHAEVSDYERLRRTLAGLRRRGLRVAVDDVGAGFSTLRHVLQLSPEIIKLDTSLTIGIDADERLRTLGRSIASFASSMGTSVVAEGVETEEELLTLRSIDVDYGQGFHLSVPAPVVRPELRVVEELSRTSPA